MTRSIEKSMLARQAHLLDDLALASVTNARIERYSELEPYYLEFRQDSKLVAILPTVPPEHPLHGHYHYYSVEPIDATRPRLSPVFLIDSTNKRLDSPNWADQPFVFDSEDSSKLEIAKRIQENPIVLFFKGCDDGHVGRRFPSVQDAMDYVDCMLYFEDIFEDELRQAHN
jgi:hypothetical protein